MTLELPRFTDVETRVLWGTFRGKSAREIAQSGAGIQESSIRYYRRKAYKKLGVKTTVEAVIKLYDGGWR